MKYTCDRCGKTFPTEKECLEHESRHDAVKGPRMVTRIEVVPDAYEPEVNIYEMSSVVDTMGRPFVLNTFGYTATVTDVDSIPDALKALLDKMCRDMEDEVARLRNSRTATCGLIEEKMAIYKKEKDR